MLFFSTSVAGFTYVNTLIYINMLYMTTNNLPFNLEEFIRNTIGYENSLVYLYGAFNKFSESDLNIDHHFNFFKNKDYYLFLTTVQPLVIFCIILVCVKYTVNSFVNLCKKHPLGMVYQYTYNLNKHLGKSFFLKSLLAIQPLLVYLCTIDLYYAKIQLSALRIISLVCVVGVLGGLGFVLIKMVLQTYKLFNSIDPNTRKEL